MSQVIRTELFPGVNLTAVHTNKFKSNYFNVSLLTGLDRACAAENALVPFVLYRGSRNYPDMQAISTRLDELYGGAIEPAVHKKGEIQCLSFSASFLDDAFALDGEQLLEPALELLGEMLLAPRTEEGVFCREFVESERTNLIDRIRAQLNDKRKYSMTRLSQEMCRYEAFGISKYGDERAVAAVTPQSLWERYQQLLATAQVELYYCGSAEPERVRQAFQAAFAALPVNPDRERPACELRITAPTEPNFVEEALDVSQGKLAMGFRTDGIGVWDEEYPALMMFNAVFGGTSMSKLFMNVREKLSLCYFASSSLEKFKGLLMISSGIEFEKFEQARDEIMAQLAACRAGEITDDELEGARRIMCTALYTMLDSQPRMADYWLGMAAADVFDTPEQLAARLEQVTKEQVVAVAERMHLDTIYFLKGKGGGTVNVLKYPRIGEQLYHKVLANGLNIFVCPKPEHAKSYAFFATNYGGVDMRFCLNGQWNDTPAGVAHFLEHKMFDTKDGNALQDLASNGASPNAFTGNDITGYYFECTEKFEDNLRILLSFVSVPWFTPESVEKEQGIIAQEIRMVEDNPHWQVFMNLMAGLYQNHPARVSVAGTVESISHITDQTLYECHRAFYTPENMVLCVAGNVDPEQVCAIAAQVLPEQGTGKVERDYGEQEPKRVAAPRVEVKMEVATPIFQYACKCDPVPIGPETLRMQLLGDLAAQALAGPSSRLYASLYRQGLINSEFECGYEMVAGCAFCYAGGESRDPDEVARQIRDEAQRLVEEGIDEVLWQRLKKAAYGSRVRGLNSFENICVGQARSFFDGAQALAFPEMFDSIGTEDAKQLLAQWMKAEGTTLSVVWPKEETV